MLILAKPKATESNSAGGVQPPVSQSSPGDADARLILRTPNLVHRDQPLG